MSTFSVDLRCIGDTEEEAAAACEEEEDEDEVEEDMIRAAPGPPGSWLASSQRPDSRIRCGGTRRRMPPMMRGGTLRLPTSESSCSDSPRLEGGDSMLYSTQL